MASHSKPNQLVPELRILQVIRGVNFGQGDGGAELYAISLAEDFLDDPSIKVRVTLTRYSANASEQLALLQLKEKRIVVETPQCGNTESARFYYAQRSLRHILKTWQPHIICTHGLQCELATVLSAGLLGYKPKLIRTRHIIREMAQKGMAGRTYDNIMPAFFYASVGVSKEITEELKRLALARKLRRPTYHLPPDISLERFAPPVRARNATLYTHNPVLMSVGRLEEQKGYATLIHAMPRVLEQIPNVQLNIAGGGSLYQVLLDICGKLGVENNVHLLGTSQDVRPLLWGADLFISSSRQEGLPAVILEAMAARVPVIATDISGTRELVTHKHTGLLVPPGDSAALADMIIYAIQHPAEMELYARAAFEMVEQEYSTTAIHKKFTAMFTEVHESI